MHKILLSTVLVLIFTPPAYTQSVREYQSQSQNQEYRSLRSTTVIPSRDGRRHTVYESYQGNHYPAETIIYERVMPARQTRRCPAYKRNCRK